MRPSFFTAVVTAATCLATPLTSVAAQDDRVQVAAVIDSFFLGMRTRDTAMMRRQTDSLSRYTLIRPGPNGPRVVLLLAAPFQASIASSPAPPIDESIRNAVFHIDRDTAIGWSEYFVRRDGALTHCGYNGYQLARLEGRWKLLSLIDSHHTTDCAPWPSPAAPSP